MLVDKFEPFEMTSNLGDSDLEDSDLEVADLEVADLEVADLDNGALTNRFRGLELAARLLEAEIATVLIEGQRRGVHADDSHRSMKGWLKANANWSNTQVSRRQRLACLLAAFPEAGEALRAGRIGVAQADELARVHANPRVTERFAESIEVLLIQAEQLSFEDARMCLKRWETLADLDGAHQDRELSQARRTATVVELGGALHLEATGGSAWDAAEMVAIFNTRVEAEFQIDVAERTRLHGPDAPTALLPRTDAQRRFDAIKAIFARSVAVPAGSKQPQPLVNVLIDERSFEEALYSHGLGPEPAEITDVDLSARRCETTSGVVVLPDDVLRAALGGHVRRVVLDAAGVVIDMGRKRRLFTGAAREAAKLMAYHCDFLGCAVDSAFTEVDHIAEWQRDGGATDTENASNPCGGHNRAKHRGFRVKRTRNGTIIYHRPDGSPMLPVGRRHPDDVETDKQLTERLTSERVAALRESQGR